MSKIHISLVGGQPMPVYLGIKYAEADAVVLVHSKESEVNADKVKEEFPDQQDRILKRYLDPLDLAHAKALAEDIADQFAGHEISLNISGGPKSWSYYFCLIFGTNPKASVFYVDQNCYVWDLKSNERKLVDFDMYAQFRLLGNPLTHFINYKEYSQDDLDAVEKIEQVRGKNYKDFTTLLSSFPPAYSGQWKHELQQKAKGKFELSKTSYVEFFKPDCVKICLTHRKLGHVTEEIQSEHAVQISFNTNWFELKVAKILAGWSNTKAIYHNCVFPLRANVAKNEVDLIVDTGSRLLFVECKTQINQSTDIDKFRTVVRNYGGQSSIGLFVIDSAFSDVALEKCKSSGLLTFSLKDFSTKEARDAALYDILDKHIENINM